MAKFHLNPETGVARRCNAEERPCPWGGESGTENHYDSIRQAREAYETRRAQDTFKSVTEAEVAPAGEPTPAPNPTPTEEVDPWAPPPLEEAVPAAPPTPVGELSEEDVQKMKVVDLVSLATVATDAAAQSLIALKNSPRVHSALIANPEVSEEALLAIAETSTNLAIRTKLVKHDRFPLDAMSIEEIKAQTKAGFGWDRDKVFARKGVTEELLDSYGRIPREALANPTAQISENFILARLDQDPMLLPYALETGRLSVKGALSRINGSAITTGYSARWVRDSASSEEQKLILNDLLKKGEANARTLSTVISGVHTDETTTAAALKALAQDETSDAAALCNVAIKRWGMTPKIAKAVKEQGPSGESIVKISLLKKKAEENGTDLDALLGATGGKPYGGKGTQYHFDAAKVKALGLTSLDMHNYVRNIYGDYLFGARYDEATGSYSGYHD